MEEYNLNKHTNKLGRGFSKPMVQFFPSLTVVFAIQLCDHKRSANVETTACANTLCSKRFFRD